MFLRYKLKTLLSPQNFITPKHVSSNSPSSTSISTFKNKFIVHGSLILVQLFFSIFHVLGKEALNQKHVDVFVFAFLRSLLASGAMFILAIFINKPEQSALGGRAFLNDRSIVQEYEYGFDDWEEIEEEEEEEEEEGEEEEEQQQKSDKKTDDYHEIKSNDNHKKSFWNEMNRDQNTHWILTLRRYFLNRNLFRSPIDTTRNALFRLSRYFTIWHLKYALLPSHRGDIWILCLCGLTGVLGNQLFFTLGLQSTGASNAAIFQPAIPIFTTIIALAIGLEKPAAMTLAGIGMAVSGSVLMVVMANFLDPHASSVSLHHSLGNIFFVINTLLFAIYLTLQKSLLARNIPPVTLSAWSFLASSVFYLFIIIPFKSKELYACFSMPFISWIALVYAAIVSTGIGYTLNSFATKHTSPSVVSVYVNVQPLASALLAAVFLGEPITWYKILSAILIAGGVLAVFKSKQEEEKEGWIEVPPLTNRPPETESSEMV